MAGGETQLTGILKEGMEYAKTLCLSDAFDFLNARGLCETLEDLKRLILSWDGLTGRDLDAADPGAYYARWTSTMGAAAIAANIMDQFGRPYAAEALATLFTSHLPESARILDYGCGSAALSLAWHLHFLPRTRLFLTDVPHLPFEFVKWRVQRRELARVSAIPTGLAEIPDQSLDLILCIDVFEHLLDPSETFKKLDAKLKPGGVLLLQAPWGGHPEHLESALADWENKGGSKCLETCYTFLRPLGPVSFSGVFRKSR